MYYYYYYYVTCTSHYSHYQTTIPTTPPPTNTLSHIYTYNLYMYDIFIHQYRVYLFYNMAGIIVFGKVELKYILYCMFGPESTFSFLLIVFFYMPSNSRHGTHTCNCAPTQYLFVGSTGTRTLRVPMFRWRRSYRMSYLNNSFPKITPTYNHHHPLHWPQFQYAYSVFLTLLYLLYCTHNDIHV